MGWGCTTRTIGVMVMVHSDDRGLVLPPRVAPLHIVIVPIPPPSKGKTEEELKGMMEQIHAQANDLCAQLKHAGLKVKYDDRDNYNPGWKFNAWEMKGVPLRFEIGMTDIAKGHVTAVRRIDDPKDKKKATIEFGAGLPGATVDMLE